MTSRPAAAALLGWVLALLLAGCIPAAASPTPATTAATPRVDFTKPGAAEAMVEALLEKAGSRRALMVEVAADSVQVSVLTGEDKPVTWAHRDGESAEVPSDLAYVDQATFDVARFNLSDVGALFRAAASMSGSEEDQTLTIVDYSGGSVTMSVSTLPESRTVFFNPDGSLLDVLNFDAPGGIAAGIEEVVASRATVYSVTVQSDQGAWVDYPGEAEGTIVRRTRTAKVPVTTNVRSETTDLPLMTAARIDPEIIWKVVDGIRGTAEVPEETTWSVIIDDRDGTGFPKMRFSIGSVSLVTDLSGTQLG